MSAEKTEAPTPKRLTRAREKGDSGASTVFSQAVAFLVALVAARGALAAVTDESTRLLRRALATGASASLAGTTVSSTARGVAESLATSVLSLTVPILLATGAAAAAVTIVQTGGVFAPARALPDLKRLDPVGGLIGLFRWQRVWSVLRALLTASFVGWMGYRTLVAFGGAFAPTVGHPSTALAVAGLLASRVAWWAAAIGLALGTLDLLVSRRSWLSRLKMTKAEVKREHRESEGDPHLKGARHRAYQEMLASAMLDAVRNATVVIVNPEHLATALRYQDDEDDAPRVVASGQGHLARQIIEAARAYGVPVVRDVPVARALRELEVGDQIPEVLYETVAEILREIWEAEPESASAGDQPAAES